MERMLDVAMKSDLVKKEIERLRLAEGTEVICEPWPYGKDGINDDERLFQVLAMCYRFNRSATFSSPQLIRKRTTHRSIIMLILWTSRVSLMVFSRKSFGLSDFL
jgi:hypothetical protein